MPTGRTFTYLTRVLANGNGTFTFSYNSTAGGQGAVTNEFNDGGGDNLTQLGDISNDHFILNSVNVLYYGATIGGGRPVSYQFGGPRYDGSGGFYPNYYFILSNRAYSTGETVTINRSARYTFACYVTDTLIRTVSGDVAVQSLTIGDLVTTASGAARPIKWIGKRSYAARFVNANPDALPVRFAAGSIADGVPARDLYVSPKHAMFLDGVLIAAEQLVNGVSVTRTERIEDELTYWHIELDSHDVLLAENAPSESFVDDDSRAMFHNAHEFAELYPDEAPVEAIYCAPRVTDGYALDAARRQLAERAGIAERADDFGALLGAIDGFDGLTFSGWAQTAAHPDAPVCLDVLVDGVIVAQTVTQGGDVFGRPQFSWTAPEMLSFGARIEIRRSADGAALSWAAGEVLAA